MDHVAHLFLLSGFGAALQELFHWYGLRNHLDKKKYERLLRSTRYWVLTGLFIMSSAILALVWFEDRSVYKDIDVVFFGLSLPLILKRALVATGAEVRLGDEASSYFDFK